MAVVFVPVSNGVVANYTESQKDTLGVMQECLHEGASHNFDKAFAAEPRTASLLRKELAEFISHEHLTEDQQFNILLATGEAFINAIEHAYKGTQGIIQVCVCAYPNCIHVRIMDFGRWWLRGDIEDMPLNPRGRGLMIMNALMDEVSLEKSDSGTVVKFRMDLQKT